MHEKNNENLPTLNKRKLIKKQKKEGKIKRILQMENQSQD